MGDLRLEVKSGRYGFNAHVERSPEPADIAEKTSLGMKEALKRGRWTFPAPLGYLNVHLADGT